MKKDDFQNKVVEELQNRGFDTTLDGNKLGVSQDGFHSFFNVDKIYADVETDDTLTVERVCDILEDSYKDKRDSAPMDLVNEFAELFSKDEVAFEELFDNERYDAYLTLINYEQNKEWLEESDVAYMKFLDLAIICRLTISDDENIRCSNVVLNPLLEKTGKNFRDVIDFLQNKNQDRIIVKDLDKYMKCLVAGEVISEASGEEQTAPSLADFDVTKSTRMVISRCSDDITEDHPLGCTLMLYNQKLYELAEILDDDLYICPSSINELIIIPSKWKTPDELLEIVEFVNNSDSMKDTDFLANTVYKYTREIDELEVAKTKEKEV